LINYKKVLDFCANTIFLSCVKMCKIFVFILILFIALVAMLFSEENGVFSASDDVHSPINDVGDVLQRYF